MCIAAVAFKGGFTKEELTAFFTTNQHGGGYAYAEKGKLVVYRHVQVLKDYVELGMKLKDKPNLVTHCRIRSTGDLSVMNAHPFLVNENKAAIVHNGTLFQTPGDDSDTKVYLTEVGHLLGNEKLMTPERIKNLGILMNFNKLIIAYDSGRITIINENKGTHEGDKWFSHMGWRIASRARGLEQSGLLN